jgi:glycosyltransferase involved in cell wall biosynthesis
MIDGMPLMPQMKGVGFYLSRCLEHFSQFASATQFAVIVDKQTPDTILPQGANLQYVRVSRKNSLWHGFRTIPRLVKAIRPDVVFIPNESPVGRLGRPYAMLCHDIPSLIRSAHYHGIDTWRQKIRDRVVVSLISRALRGARLVFSNSRFVARWLEEEVHIPTARLRLAPCAPAADFRRLSQKVNREEVRRQLETPQGYILAFSTGDSRENFPVIPQTYQKIVDQGFPQALVIAGVREHLKPALEALLSSYTWRERVRLVPFITSAQDLAGIYCAAQVYLDPSLSEGFGMQVVEAMACGTPVVCSNGGALPEVAGDAAILVQPSAVAEMAEAVANVLRDKELRERLRQRGYDQAARYSWAQTADTIYTGLRTLAVRRS